MLRTASKLNLTRMDLPFLLGIAVTADRVRAKAIGHARMGTSLSDAGTVSLLDSPGFMLRNYGLQTPWSASRRMSRTARSSRSSSPWPADAGVLFSH